LVSAILLSKFFSNIPLNPSEKALFYPNGDEMRVSLNRVKPLRFLRNPRQRIIKKNSPKTPRRSSFKALPKTGFQKRLNFSLRLWFLSILFGTGCATKELSYYWNETSGINPVVSKFAPPQYREALPSLIEGYNEFQWQRINIFEGMIVSMKNRVNTQHRNWPNESAWIELGLHYLLETELQEYMIRWYIFQLITDPEFFERECEQELHTKFRESLKSHIAPLPPHLMQFSILAFRSPFSDSLIPLEPEFFTFENRYIADYTKRRLEVLEGKREKINFLLNFAQSHPNEMKQNFNEEEFKKMIEIGSNFIWKTLGIINVGKEFLTEKSYIIASYKNADVLNGISDRIEEALDTDKKEIDSFVEVAKWLQENGFASKSN